MSELTVLLIEDLRVCRDDKALEVISSRKTRGLLIYLLLTEQPQRREALCELFFSETSDPRSALRWSLSKLRLLLDCDERERLMSDADTVFIDASDIMVDFHDVHRISVDGGATLEDLESAATQLSGQSHFNCAVPKCDEFNTWLIEKRAELAKVRSIVFSRLTKGLDDAGQSNEKWLRTWWRLEPQSHSIPEMLWRSFRDQNLLSEAEVVLQSYRSLMGAKALDWSRENKTLPLKIMHQKVNYCTTEDNVRIAYSATGKGQPLVKTANWLNHLNLDWKSPIWADTFRALSNGHKLIRYDERGNGLSDWDVDDISFDAFVKDLATVVDTNGLGRFPLLGMSQGCAVSIAYAIQNPERVSSLILIGGYASGWRIGMSAEEQERREAVLTLTRLGWGTSNPAYRHIFSQTFMPDADAERLAWFDDFQRQTTSPENAVRFQEAFGTIDVRHLLSQVKVPTLVLHAAGDLRIPLEHGRELAKAIPQATLIELDSRSHIILGDEPAWQVMVDAIQNFLLENS